MALEKGCHRGLFHRLNGINPPHRQPQKDVGKNQPYKERGFLGR